MKTENVPEGWNTERLSQLCVKLRSGGTPRVSNPEYYNGNISFVKIEDMTKNGKYIENTKTNITEGGLNNSSAWLIPKNSILFSIYASVGEVAITKRELATNQAIMGLCPDKDKIDTRYLYEYLRYIKPSLSKYFKITTQKNLTAEIAKNLEINHPSSLQEQQKIAEILTIVDEAIEETGRVISACEKIKKGIIFTEIDIVGYGAGTQPISKVLDLGKCRSGIYKEKVLYGKGTRILKISDVFCKDVYDGEECQRVNLSEKELSSNEATEFDILISLASLKKEGVGKVMLIRKLRERTAFDHNVACLRHKKKEYNPVFLFYTLKSRTIRKRIEALCTQVGTTFLKGSEINKLPIPKVSLIEQNRIAETITSIEERIQQEKKKKISAELLKKALMQKLLTGQIRVKVD